MAQEEAQEQAQKYKEWGLVVPIAMGLPKSHKFTTIIDNTKKDKDKTPLPFNAIQLGQERWETYAFIDSRANNNTISQSCLESYKMWHW